MERLYLFEGLRGSALGEIDTARELVITGDANVIESDGPIKRTLTKAKRQTAAQ